MRWLATVAVVAFLLSGCAGPRTTDPTPTDGNTEENVAYAPWWPVGSAWTVDSLYKGKTRTDLTLVNFWNDSATTHFWLGVADTEVALDHALNNTLPLLGRIHWYILTPHESGIHAAGMYRFPVTHGQEFTGTLLGREWTVKATEAATPGVFDFEGKAPDGSTLKYDYRPDFQWFSSLEIKGPSGNTQTRVTVKSHTTDAHGTYHFYRGRDYYANTPEKPAQAGKDYSFEVKNEEGRDPIELAILVKGEVEGLLNMEILDPEGQSQFSKPLVSTKDELEVRHVYDPKVGSGWKVKFTGSGTFSGEIKVVGLLEFKATI